MLPPSFRCMFRPPGRLRPANQHCGEAGDLPDDLLAHTSQTRPRRLVRCASHRDPAGSRDPGAGRRRGVHRRLHRRRRPARRAGPGPGPGGRLDRAGRARADRGTRRRARSGRPWPPRPRRRQRRRRRPCSSPLPCWLPPRPRSPPRPSPPRPHRPPHRPDPHPRTRATAFEWYRAGHADSVPCGGHARAGRSRHSAAGRVAAGRRSPPSGADTHAPDDPRRAA